MWSILHKCRCFSWRKLFACYWVCFLQNSFRTTKSHTFCFNIMFWPSGKWTKYQNHWGEGKDSKKLLQELCWTICEAFSSQGEIVVHGDTRRCTFLMGEHPSEQVRGLQQNTQLGDWRRSRGGNSARGSVDGALFLVRDEVFCATIIHHTSVLAVFLYRTMSKERFQEPGAWWRKHLRRETPYWGTHKGRKTALNQDASMQSLLSCGGSAHTRWMRFSPLWSSSDLKRSV